MLNRVVLIGRLAKDPELRYTNSGTAVSTFTLAVDRPRPNQSGERETDFINIVVWQKLAELCAQYLHKGRMAAVDGRLQIRTYENRDGHKVRVAEVIAELVRFLDRADANGKTATAADTQQSKSAPGKPAPTSKRFEDDPFADDDPFGDDLGSNISEDDLPF
ncbi:MAG: single-stranded DNA-binding protein [Alicyclobacillus macrosporangiidus]|uniref:single-stranded DNA-binding protein n=1 Tax=Alicyclobacillus macrosporangiidus TaxID=392015 RepID=UPI0026EF6C09|nr:single-stranded DNA-binding protein [Alicyclobacillus macrosporangiidus]MCL6600836.1 single-stranded DNA-binding protein [Alicyclobacillus macrosporangiidus]